MRLHIDQPVMRFMRGNEEARKLIKTLFDDPAPGWATRLEDYAERYEFFVDKRTIQVDVDRTTDLETIVKVTFSDNITE